jgi:hypothetical protein
MSNLTHLNETMSTFQVCPVFGRGKGEGAGGLGAGRRARKKRGETTYTCCNSVEDAIEHCLHHHQCSYTPKLRTQHQNHRLLEQIIGCP